MCIITCSWVYRCKNVHFFDFYRENYNLCYAIITDEQIFCLDSVTPHSFESISLHLTTIFIEVFLKNLTLKKWIYKFLSSFITLKQEELRLRTFWCNNYSKPLVIDIKSRQRGHFHDLFRVFFVNFWIFRDSGFLSNISIPKTIAGIISLDFLKCFQVDAIFIESFVILDNFENNLNEES